MRDYSEAERRLLALYPTEELSMAMLAQAVAQLEQADRRPAPTMQEMLEASRRMLPEPTEPPYLYVWDEATTPRRRSYRTPKPRKNKAQRAARRRSRK